MRALLVGGCVEWASVEGSLLVAPPPQLLVVVACCRCCLNDSGPPL